MGYSLHSHAGGCGEEISLILASLDVFYRYCPELVTEESIRTQGPELLRLLPRVLTQLKTSHVGGTVVENASNLLLPVVSIWHSCSSCVLGSTLLLQHPATLPAIQELLQKGHDNLDGVMESLGLLKNLTYFGEDHRHRIVDHPINLITTLTGLTGVFEDKARERLSAVFRNLALSTDVRQRLAQRADVLTALIRMAASCCDGSINEHTTFYARNDYNVPDNHGRDVNARRTTLRNLLSATASLAMDSASTPWMVSHGDGVLVDQMKRFMVHDEDPVVRKRATRVLRLLAREPSAALLLRDDYLLEALSDRALHDSNEAVRTEAVEAFAQCASLVRAHPNNYEQYQAVLRSLTKLATNPEVSSEAVARAIQEQASRPENRTAMAQQKELVEAMAHIALSKKFSRAAKESVCTALVDLSRDEANHEAIAIPAVLDSLVRLLSDHRGYGTSESWVNDENQNNSSNNINGSSIGTTTRAMKESTIRTILNLAKTPSNRKIMASQAALLQSLLRVAAATSTDGLKEEVKGAILQLASEL